MTSTDIDEDTTDKTIQEAAAIATAKAILALKDKENE